MRTGILHLQILFFSGFFVKYLSLTIILLCAVLFFGEAAMGKKEEVKVKKKDVRGHLVFVKDVELSRLKGKEKERLLEVVGIAEKDQAVLLKLAVDSYKKNVKDYTGTFVKQECVDGELFKEQEIDFKFREKPYSVYMVFKKNATSADKVLYVEGENDDKMVAHPTGLFSFLDSVKREPDCKAAMKENLFPCSMFGINSMMQKAMRDNAGAKKAGDLQMKYLGVTKVDGRLCVAGERRLPKKKGYPDGRLIVQIDIERLVPLDVRSYGWDDELIFKYLFSNLKFNVGLKDKDFDVEACGL